MNNYFLKWHVLLLSSVVVLKVVNSDLINVTTEDDTRHPRVSGRIIKLYTGTKPEPITCTEEGFRSDPADCSVFYRCIKVKNDRYSVLRFQCGPGTVYDPDNEVCNHPQNTKRSECRSSRPYEFFSAPVLPLNENEIDAHELPSPITTQRPYITSQTLDKVPSNDVYHQQDMVSSIYDTYSPINQTHQSDESYKLTKSTVATDLTSKTISVSDSQYKTTSSYSTKEYTPAAAAVHSTSEQSDNQCISDGFMGDNNDCRKFYRCVNNIRGGFTKYEFMCSETTIWDDDLQSCNHPWAVRRRTCRNNVPFDYNIKNEHYNKINNTSGLDSASYGEQKQKYSEYSTSIISTSTPNYYGDRINHNRVSNTWPSQNNVYVPNIQYSTNKLHNVTESTTQYGDFTYQTHINLHEFVTTPHDNLIQGKNDSALSEVICTESGFIGDPNNCKKFYRCVQDGKGGYTRHEFLCGERTAWDVEAESCNHEWLVKECGGKKRYEISSTEKDFLDKKSTSTTTNIVSENNIYAMESNNFKDEKPQFGSKVSKALQETTETIIGTTTNTLGLDSSAKMCKFTGYFGDTTDCRKFYRCVENAYGGFTKFEYICDEGSAWDPKIEICNHESKVNNCGSNPIIDSKVSLATTESAITTTISLKQTTIQSSYVSQNNDVSSNVNYHQSSSPDTIQTSRAKVCQENGFMADQYDCRKFYRCVENENGGFVRFEYTCGDGTAWDTKINACNHLRAVETCENNTFKKSTPLQDSTYESHKNVDNSYTTQGYNNNALDFVKTTTEGTADNSVASKSPSTTIRTNEIVCTSDSFIGDSVNCKKFYRCVSNSEGGYLKYEFSCGEGTVWDPEIEACNHIGSVKTCGGSSLPPYTVSTSKPLLTTQLVNDELDSGYTQGLSETNAPAQSSSQSTSIKPPSVDKNQTCSSVGFFGDATNCKKFYRCVENGQGGFNRFEFTCGDGTAWDPNTETCDHASPDNLNCPIIPTIEPTSKPTTPVTIDTSSTQHIQNNIEINDHSSIDQHDDSLYEPNNGCLAEGFYSNKMDCKKFYRCVQNGDGKYERYDFACGEGTIWVQDIQACDHDIDNSTCKNKETTVSESPASELPTTPVSTTITTSTAQNGVTNGTPKPAENSVTNISENSECASEGYYPNSKDCRQFYRCTVDEHGTLTKYDYFCGEGTAWDLNTQTCNYITAVNRCSSKETQTTTSATTLKEPLTTEINTNIKTTNTPTSISSTAMIEDSSSTDTCDNEGYFGDSENCQKFYRCVNNGQRGFTKYEYICGEGTIWDQDIVTCNYPSDVKNPSCNKESKTTSTSAGTESSVQTTRTTNSLTSQSTSTSSIHTTSSTSENPIQGTSNCPSTENSKNENIACTKAGYFANPQNCKKFYRCVDWDGDGKRFSVFHFECGEGTIWDPALDTCNYEDSVYPPRNCSGSQTQTENSTSTSTTQSTTATQQITSTESTTQEQSSTEITTTTQSTSTTVEQQTTPTTEKSTSVQSTTESLSSSETTTIPINQSTSTETTSASTDLTSTASTEKSTTTIQTTTEQQSTSTTEQSSSESTTTYEQTSTTTEKSTTMLQTTTEQQSTTTTAQASTDQTTTSEQSSTEQSTSTISQSSTDQSTTATEQTSTEQTSSTNDQSTTTTEQQSSSTQTTASSTEPSTSTDQTSTQGSTTTQQMSTDSSTENQSSSSTTDESTTNTSTTTESNQETTTTESSSTNKCPDTESDQYLYVCPTSFKRHPKYCNLFYQCLEDNDTHELKIAVFNCPNGTIYDEGKIQCVEENNADKKCQGIIANNRRIKRLNVNSREIITASNNTYRCQRAGHFPFENTEECSPALLKCEISKTGQLRGFVYRCPENYAYWSISRKCEPISKLANCNSSYSQWSKRWEIPIERKNVAK